MGSVSFPALPAPPSQCRVPFGLCRLVPVVLFFMERKRFVLTVLGWRGRCIHHPPMLHPHAGYYRARVLWGHTGLLTVFQKIRGQGWTEFRASFCACSGEPRSPLAFTGDLPSPGQLSAHLKQVLLQDLTPQLHLPGEAAAVSTGACPGKEPMDTFGSMAAPLLCRVPLGEAHLHGGSSKPAFRAAKAACGSIGGKQAADGGRAPLHRETSCPRHLPASP